MSSPNDPSSELDFGATLRGFSTGQRLFDRYALKEILGRGGMGVVWRAFDEQLERDVALKFLPELVAFDEQAIKDLKRETKKSQELRHHHIVQVYDFVADKQHACISMEYVDGPTLSALKARNEKGFFEPDDIKDWIEQLCEALTYAHERAHVVHRDLKPANLMLNSQDELKITDFGIARSVSDSVSMLTMARGGTSGTLVYMSPQQLRGERPTYSDDIYSVGACIFELLTGKPPFYTGDVTDQIKNVTASSMQKRREQFELNGKQIPNNWETTVAACLAKDSAQRPQNARELASRLGVAVPAAPKAAVAAAVSAAPPPAAAGVLAKPKPRDGWSPAKTKRSLFFGAGIVALIVCGALAGWYFGIEVPKQKERKAEEARIATERQQKQLQEQESAKAKAAVERAQNEAKAQAEHLANAKGAALIKTEPEGATVVLGDQTEKSPASFNGLKVGTLSLKVTLDGYLPHKQDIDIKENEITDPGPIKLVRLASVSTPVPGASTVAAARPSPAAAVKPSPSAQSRKTFAGTWVGSAVTKCQGAAGGASYTLIIPPDESNIFAPNNGKRWTVHRRGDTLAWEFSGGGARFTDTLTLIGENSARFSTVGKNPDGTTCRTTGTLKRQ